MLPAPREVPPPMGCGVDADSTHFQKSAAQSPDTLDSVASWLFWIFPFLCAPRSAAGLRRRFNIVSKSQLYTLLEYIDIYIQISGELTFENFYQRREVPPPTGFGSDADSMQSIYNLIPKVPRRDEGKLMDLQVEYEPVVHHKEFLKNKGMKRFNGFIPEAPRRDPGTLVDLQIALHCLPDTFTIISKYVYFNRFTITLGCVFICNLIPKTLQQNESKLIDLQVTSCFGRRL